jgi:arginine/lysine/ornithine decarboxylase
LRYDLPPIIQAAHAKGIKVIIDEAWYGFARFHPAFRPTALEAGADYATQSTHKVLSAFSQSSMIHVNDPDFKRASFSRKFQYAHIYQSAVQYDREPGCGTQTGCSGRLQTFGTHTGAVQGAARAD